MGRVWIPKEIWLVDVKEDRMSWGERSCANGLDSTGKVCEYNPTMATCNVDCPGYVWDGITEPDSIKKMNITDMLKDFGK